MTRLGFGPIVVIGACLLTASPAMHASQITPDLFVDLGAGISPTAPCTQGAMSSAGQAAIALSETDCDLQPAAGTALFSASSAASYTDGFQLSSSMALTGANLSATQLDSAYARLSDNLVFLSDASSVAYVSLGIHLTGSWEDSGLSEVKPILTFGFNYPNGAPGYFGPSQWKTTATSGSVDTTFWPAAAPVSDFQNYSYFISFAALLGENSGSSLTAAGDLDFTEVKIVDYRLTDSSGNQILGVDVTSQGLQDSTPEPGTALLGLAGLLPLAAAARRARRTR